MLGVAGYAVVHRSLRPLVEVEQTAAAIAAGELDRRVPQRDPRTEVGRLSLALNGMLAQIQRAVASSEASAEQARSSEERMRRFITDASHELRTPLTTIRGFAELYRQGAARDIELLMSRIESESRRMGLLVEDLLLLARLDAQRPLEQHRVDLLALASDAVHDAQSIAPNATIAMEVFDGPGTPEVLGDDARLRQVLGNLVANALQHTPDTAGITVRVGTDGDNAVLEVCDEGPGHEPEDAHRVFERFYRADSSRARASGGTGLGLSIVDSLVYAHGGTVTRHAPRPGTGCRFRVSLPRIAERARSGRAVSERGLDLGLRLVEGLRGRVAVDVGEPEVGQVAGREHVHVQVRHLQAGDDHARPAPSRTPCTPPCRSVAIPPSPGRTPPGRGPASCRSRHAARPACGPGSSVRSSGTPPCRRPRRRIGRAVPR